MLASEAHERAEVSGRAHLEEQREVGVHRPVDAHDAGVPRTPSYFAQGSDVTWAVLDSGIHWTHPHFGGEKGTIKNVYDCTNRKQRQLSGDELDLH